MTRGSRPSGTGTRVAQAVVALGLLLAGGGCASREPYKRFLASYTINVEFTKVANDLCATAVDTQVRNCNKDRPKDCLRAGRGQKVTFQAVDAAGNKITNDFEIRFDPFKNSTIRSANGVTPPHTIDGPVAPDKAYPFNVYTAGLPACPVIDPQIIIEY
jgi:hypothetical protein